MNRRNFVNIMGVKALAITLSTSFIPHKTKGRVHNLTVNDVNNYLRSLHKVEEPSVDRIIIGDPDAVVSKIGTCWMPYRETLRKAVKAGVNTLIVHEPTFYTHHDLRNTTDDYMKAPQTGKNAYLKLIEEKRKWIEDNKLSIIRCHDVLDILPNFGIPYAWGIALGFSNKDIIRSEPYYNIYKVEPETALNLAKRIAGNLKEFDQPGVAFYGDKNRIVKSIGVGTGCFCDPLQYMELKPDLYVAIDDSVRTWIQTYYARDSGDPLIVVNHGTSEENGVRMLSAHLKEVFLDIEIIHFNQGCSYQWIS
ncbi:MAG: Nif3-like dinuclear metal center hexameric protein [Mangrovibacterium sp.]